MIEGILYENRSAANKKAVLLISNENYVINIEDTTIFEGKLHCLLLSPRIGNIERKITLEDGSVFATKDNDTVDRLILKVIKKNNLLFKLESNILLIIFAFIFTCMFAFSSFKWGIPYVSKKIAYSLPLEANNIISENTLQVFDKYIFTPSKLSEEKKQNIVSNFNSRLLPLIEDNKKINYKIHFRQWKMDDKHIANAFALPNGDIVLTDKFIQLSQHQDEIIAVLLHEVGHIENRHSLQRLIQGTFTAVIVMYISSDTTSFADMGIGLGSLFISSEYSRNFESEADVFAFEKMLKANIDPENFANIIGRITSSTKVKEDGILDYMSSHPRTSNRIDMSKKYSECFKSGNTKCP